MRGTSPLWIVISFTVLFCTFAFSKNHFVLICTDLFKARLYQFAQHVVPVAISALFIGAAGRIRTGEPLRERITHRTPSPILSPPPLTWLGYRRPHQRNFYTFLINPFQNSRPYQKPIRIQIEGLEAIAHAQALLRTKPLTNNKTPHNQKVKTK